jgi:3-phosphoshikimate 1-carboxyvinyltransferase
MPGVGINPSRRAAVDLLCSLGADVLLNEARDICNEPVANIKVRGGIGSPAQHTPVIRGATVANLIDEIPIIAILGTQLPAGLEVRDAAELRVKETDRVMAIVHNLRKMGADVTEFEDGFRVERSELVGSEITTFGDHRIAMAFAVAGLLARGKTYINDAACAAVSFPSFFDTLEQVVVR